MKSNFRTPVSLQKNDFNLSHQNDLLLMGSCFSNNIGKRLEELKFNARVNPFGISYHPLAIHKQLQLQKETEIDINESNGVFFSFDFHSEQNQLSKEKYVSLVQNNIEQLRHSLEVCHTVIITYGSAWVYELKQTQQIVNNCHQQPAQRFKKRILSVKEIVDSWKETADFLEQTYGTKQMIFTVSPVRHLKDGFHENQLSKATLQLAVDEICKTNASYSYFPAYEILLDDLRDYRFYKDDLVHPNQLAIDYIWNAFEQTYFQEDTILLNQKVKKLILALHHKAFQPHSEKHQAFLKKLMLKLQTIQKHSSLDFKKEIESVSAQLLP